MVVGGGIIGLAAARELAGRGLSVTLLERDEPSLQASAAAAGMLAPLAEVPEPGPMFEAARDARDRWGEFAAEVADDAGLDSPDAFGYDTSGALAVAADDETAEALTGLARAATELGEVVSEMPVDEARRLVPDVTADLRRALHLPGDHRVDNVAFCRALVTAARSRGVLVQPGSEVESLEETADGVRLRIAGSPGGEGGPRTLEAGAVLLAAGAWSGKLLGSPTLPVSPVRGQMMSLGDVHWPWTGSVRAGERYVVRRQSLAKAVRREDTVLVGATVEADAGFQTENTASGLADLTAFVRRLFPGLADRPVRSVWAGLRPGSPDGLPFIGAVPGRSRTWVATGHYRNGILLAPWTARRITDRIIGGEPAPEADPFALEGRLG